MSVVSGVVLTFGCMEGPFYPNSFDRWLEERNFGPLANLTPHTGGNKNPQMWIWGAGYNYFPEAEFAWLVLAYPWQTPEEVVLLIHPEDGPTQVWRP